MSAALTVQGLWRQFGGGRTLLGQPRPAVQAIRDVTFQVEAGETLGIVGESGCGKSTLARMLVGLLAPSRGSIRVAGEDISTRTSDPTAYGRLVQYVFQDPISSLNPRKTIREILETPLRYLMHMDASARRSRVVRRSTGLRPG